MIVLLLAVPPIFNIIMTFFSIVRRRPVAEASSIVAIEYATAVNRGPENPRTNSCWDFMRFGPMQRRSCMGLTSNPSHVVRPTGNDEPFFK